MLLNCTNGHTVEYDIPDEGELSVVAGIMPCVWPGCSSVAGWKRVVPTPLDK